MAMTKQQQQPATQQIQLPFCRHLHLIIIYRLMGLQSLCFCISVIYFERTELFLSNQS